MSQITILIKIIKGFICLCLLFFLVGIATFVANSYWSQQEISRIRDRPILSFVELLSITDPRLLENREVSFPAFWGADRQFYLSSEESSLKNVYASFSVEYSEAMDRCLGEYVFIQATLRFVPEHHGYIFADITKFIRVGSLEEKSKNTKNMEELLELLNSNILC